MIFEYIGAPNELGIGDCCWDRSRLLLFSSPGFFSFGVSGGLAVAVVLVDGREYVTSTIFFFFIFGLIY